MYTIDNMNSKLYIDRLPRKLLNVINHFNETDKKARNFGTDTVLHLSEIHLIEFIGNNENLSVSEIARRRNVTKGAISQTLIRLEDKKPCYKSTEFEEQVTDYYFINGKGLDSLLST